MTYWLWVLFYAAVTAGTVSIVILDKRRSGDALGAVSVLALLWVLSNLSHVFLDPFPQFFPFLDAFTACVMAWAWVKRLNGWKVGLILLFVAECLIHAGFFAAGDWSHAALYAYTVKRNVLFMGQLGCVASPTVVRVLHSVLAKSVNGVLAFR